MQRSLCPHTRLAGMQRLAIVLELFSLLGCVEPAYEESARTNDAAVGSTVQTTPDARVEAPDARVAGDSPRDSWQKALAPEYAVRMRFFGRDRLTGAAAVLRHEIIMHARIELGANGEVEMEAQRCSDVGYIDGVIKDEFRWSHPEQLPAERFGLVLRDGKIETISEPRLYGYTESVPAACVPGGQAPRLEEQVWLGTSPCECAAGELPQLSTDCRVTDVDHDKLAGLTVQHTSFVGTESVRLKDSSQVVQGELTSDGRLRGYYLENYDYLGLSCGSTPCGHNDILVCPLDQNPVWFEPLTKPPAEGGAWDCSAVLRSDKAGELFPSEMLSFPADC